MSDTVSTFAAIVLQAMPGNAPNPPLHNTVEVRILSGEGACSFKAEEIKACVDRVTSIATVLVDGKVVAEIPASVIPKEAVKLLYWQLTSPVPCLSADAPLREVPCHD